MTDSTGTLAPFYILINVLYIRREESGFTFYALTATVKRYTWAMLLLMLLLLLLLLLPPLYYRAVRMVVCLRNSRHIHTNNGMAMVNISDSHKIHNLIETIVTSTVAIKVIFITTEQQEKQRNHITIFVSFFFFLVWIGYVFRHVRSLVMK